MTQERKRILVIEDHKSVRLLLQALLKQLYQVETTSNGLAGMAWLNKGNKPDLILLDMNMPEINGLHFLDNLRNSGLFSQIPVVVISGNNDEQEKAACLKLGAKQIFEKPFSPTKLKDSIHEILGGT